MKSFSKQFFAIIIALLFATALFGVMTVSAETVNGEKTSADGVIVDGYDGYYDETNGEGNKENIFNNVAFVSYDQNYTFNYGETYRIAFYLEGEHQIASFNLELSFPWFMENISIEPTYELIDNCLNRYETAMFDYNVQDKNCFISLTSPYAIQVCNVFDVTFTISDSIPTNAFEYIYLYQHEWVTENADYVYPDIRLGYVQVTRENGEEPETFKKGDANVDGFVDIYDLMLMQQSIVRKTELSYVGFTNADINNDGFISSIDTQYVQMFLVGKIGSLENVNGGGNDGGEIPSDEVLSIVLHVDFGNGGTDSYIRVKSGENIWNFIRHYAKENNWEVHGLYLNDYYENIVDEGMAFSNDIKELYVYAKEMNNDYEERTQVYVTYVLYYNGNTYPIGGGSRYVGKDVEFRSFVEEFQNEFVPYTVDGYYFDEGLTKPYYDEYVLQPNDSIFVKCLNYTLSGSYNVKSLDLNEIGSAWFDGDSYQAGIALDGKEYVGEYYYGNVDSEERSILITIQTEDGALIQHNLKIVEEKTADGMVERYLVLNKTFDSSEFEQNKELTPIAGKYSTYSEVAPNYDITLYDNGIFLLNYAGATLIDMYSYVDGVLTFEGLPFTGKIFDGNVIELFLNEDIGGGGTVDRIAYEIMLFGNANGKEFNLVFQAYEGMQLYNAVEEFMYQQNYKLLGLYFDSEYKEEVSYEAYVDTNYKLYVVFEEMEISGGEDVMTFAIKVQGKTEDGKSFVIEVREYDSVYQVVSKELEMMGIGFERLQYVTQDGMAVELTQADLPYGGMVVYYY